MGSHILTVTYQGPPLKNMDPCLTVDVDRLLIVILVILWYAASICICVDTSYYEC